MILVHWQPIPLGVTRGELIRAVLAAVVLLCLCAGLATTYVGHSPSPYGACYTPNGRTGPCELVAHTK
jgi:hypothetical protein